MKVTNQSGPKLQGIGGKKVGSSGLDRPSEKNKANSADTASSAKVDLSPRAREAKKIREMANQAPDVDEAKVAKFRDLIERGAYKVDAAAVADRLVDASLLDAAAEADND